MGTPRKRGIEKEGARRMEGSDGMKETDGHKDTRNGGGKAWRDESHVRDGMEGRKAGRRDGAEKHRGKRGRGLREEGNRGWGDALRDSNPGCSGESRVS